MLLIWIRNWMISSSISITRECKANKNRDLWTKEVYLFVNGIVGEAFGKLYVEKYFLQRQKAEMVVLVDYVKKAFASRIKKLDWMSSVTKRKKHWINLISLL